MGASWKNTLEIATTRERVELTLPAVVQPYRHISQRQLEDYLEKVGIMKEIKEQKESVAEIKEVVSLQRKRKKTSA